MWGGGVGAVLIFEENAGVFQLPTSINIYIHFMPSVYDIGSSAFNYTWGLLDYKQLRLHYQHNLIEASWISHWIFLLVGRGQKRLNHIQTKLSLSHRDFYSV